MKGLDIKLPIDYFVRWTEHFKVLPLNITI